MLRLMGSRANNGTVVNTHTASDGPEPAVASVPETVRTDDIAAFPAYHPHMSGLLAQPPKRSRSIPKSLGVFPYNLEKANAARLFTRLLLRFFPMYFIELARFELRNARLRALAPLRARPFRGQRNLLVQVGCGPNGRDGWVNMDCFPRETVNCLYDIRRDLPFDDESVSGIFCEHVFEHLDYSQAVPTFLAECYRCLAPGGVLRIIVPDAGRYLHAYAAGGFDAFVPMRQLVDRKDPWLRHTYRTPMELVNAVYHQGSEHHFGYDAETLEFVLRHAGFDHVTPQAFGRSHDTVMCLDLPERATESLYMEAVKS